MNQETYLAIDFGGTNVRVGEVNADGEILAFKKYPTGYLNQKEALEAIERSIRDYIDTEGWFYGTRPRSAGVGVLGRVNNAEGIWLQIDPKRSEPLALAGDLEAIFGLPFFIDNDVKSATRAEQIWGFGKLSENFIYINIGTGIAAGFIINGKLLRGSHYNASEVGHTRVGINIGLTCGCGRTDCVEQIAAGIGFDRSARLLKDRFATSLYISDDDKERVDVKEVYRLYQQQDPLSMELVDNASSAIAELIMNLVRVSDPDTVVLGGGIVSDHLMFNLIKSKLNQTTVRFVKNGINLTNLHPDFIGLLGAAAVAINK